jgi:hypothetical protein
MGRRPGLIVRAGLNTKAAGREIGATAVKLWGAECAFTDVGVEAAFLRVTLRQ